MAQKAVIGLPIAAFFMEKWKDMDKSNPHQAHPLYHLDELMVQTRKIAAQYRLQTGQILPISNELAKYDAQKILDLSPLSIDSSLKGVDCVLPGTLFTFQIKARVVFKINAPQRVGQLNLSGDWSHTLLVIYDDHYQPDKIYGLEKNIILRFIQDQAKSLPNKRGMISVGKFKALGQCIWSVDNGLILPLNKFVSTLN